MAEAIHCPSCSTRYRLRLERVRPAHRRARCYACGDIFPVDETVRRLLAEAFPAAEEPAPEPVPALTLSDLEPEAEETLEDALSDLEPEAEDPLEDVLVEAAPASAALADTLSDAPLILPESKDPFLPAEHPAAEADPVTASGYTSARDAIDKLFADTPLQAPAMHFERGEGPMDMDAALSALDATLPSPPAVPETVASGVPGDDPLAQESPSELPHEISGASNATVRISQEELLAALASVPASVAEEAAPVPAFQALPEAAEVGAELLRLKVGAEIYGGLTMPQLIAWVEEGRILEQHLVARQHSENWLEAFKVPGLRPVFERLRRTRTGSVPTLEAPAPEPEPKKGFLSSLFGRN
ncbi:MAG: zinc-ribbon domain-containing protein [Acidobacteria bacterium]|nr:zinc-ribbon domain-containing protein [Acidobacteriota bacterium]